MAGYAGSTLVEELNRLANASVYPSPSAMLDGAGAANKWAGTTGLDVVGALNAKAGNATDLKDVAGVCNQLAGTVGFEPAAALRSMP